jgi:hypothetical protein
MSFIIATMSVPFLMATGIYNPKVVHTATALPSRVVLTRYFVHQTQRLILGIARKLNSGA